MHASTSTAHAGSQPVISNAICCCLCFASSAVDQSPRQRPAPGGQANAGGRGGTANTDAGSAAPAKPSAAAAEQQWRTYLHTREGLAKEGLIDGSSSSPSGKDFLATSALCTGSLCCCHQAVHLYRMTIICIHVGRCSGSYRRHIQLQFVVAAISMPLLQTGLKHAA